MRDSTSTAATAVIALVVGLLSLMTSGPASASAPAQAAPSTIARLANTEEPPPPPDTEDPLPPPTAPPAVPVPKCYPTGGDGLGFCWSNRANDQVTFHSLKTEIAVIFTYRDDEYGVVYIQPGKSLTVPHTSCSKTWSLRIAGQGYPAYYTLPKCAVSTPTPQASGSLTKKSPRKVAVVMNARGIAGRTTFRLTKHGLTKRSTRVYTYTLVGTRKVFTKKVKPNRGKKGTLISLMVKRPNGTWQLLDRERLPRRR